MAHMRVVRFTLSPENRGKDQEIGNDLVPAIKAQPGCSGAFFASNSDGECALLVLWDSAERADAAAVVISPRLMGHINGKIVGPADIHLLRILAD